MIELLLSDLRGEGVYAEGAGKADLAGNLLRRCPGAAIGRVSSCRAGHVDLVSCRSSMDTRRPRARAPTGQPNRSEDMPYIDVFVLAVPTGNKQEFIEHARQLDPIFN